MGHRDKFNIILGVRTKSAYRNSHTAFQISLAFDLRTVIFADGGTGFQEGAEADLVPEE